jgi:hypothetical protein
MNLLQKGDMVYVKSPALMMIMFMEKEKEGVK